VGHDQTDIEAEARKAVEEKGLAIKVIRIGRFGKPELNSSLKIKKKIMELYKGRYE
jgi:glycerol-3-phosphate cytidylyltransferase-like family protein